MTSLSVTEGERTAIKAEVGVTIGFYAEFSGNVSDKLGPLRGELMLRFGLDDNPRPRTYAQRCAAREWANRLARRGIYPPANDYVKFAHAAYSGRPTK